MNKILSMAFIAFAIAACSKGASVAEPTNALEKPTSAPVHVATLDEWKSALASTYDKDKVTDEGDGVTKFAALFHTGSDKKQRTFTFGTRDAFRKLTIFQPGLPMNIVTSVKAYVSVRDGRAPVLFLAPYYWGEGSWLFMNKIAVMADGDVIFERDLQDFKVERDTEGVGVAELCQFILTPEEIAALRKIQATSKVNVRLSGKKGYVNLENRSRRKGTSAVGEFQRDIIDAISVYDSINQAIQGHIPPEVEKAS